MHKHTEHQPWPPARTVTVKVKDRDEAAKVEQTFADYNLQPVRVMRTISQGKTIKYLFEKEEDANLANIVLAQAFAAAEKAYDHALLLNPTGWQPPSRTIAARPAPFHVPEKAGTKSRLKKESEE